jgi:hypothetical protein
MKKKKVVVVVVLGEGNSVRSAQFRRIGYNRFKRYVKAWKGTFPC